MASLDQPPQLPGKGAFLLLASITVSGLAGSSLPTPLYPMYQAAWGFSAGTVTSIFAIYALAVLAALLVAGRLSDHLGRRPVLLVSSAVQVVAMLVMATANGVPALVAGRIIQGLATGAALAAVGASLVDIDQVRGAVGNAMAPILGTASGALFAGVAAHYLPAPTHLSYSLLAGVFVAQFVGLWRMAEPLPLRKPGALASLRPRLNVPAAARGRMLLVVPAVVASWSLPGFYASLGPALVHRVFQLDATLHGGMALFCLTTGGAVAVGVLQSRAPGTVMRLGTGALVAGTALVLAGISTASLPLFVLGTLLAGMGFGSGFQGAVRSVVALAPQEGRAGVLAVVFVVSYLSMGVPAVLAGMFVSAGTDIVDAAEVFGGGVMLLALLALAGDVFAASPRRAGLRPLAQKSPGA